jgi:transposase
MFFRTKIISGSRLVQLVHSYRNSEGLPRQKVIASLGDAAIPEPEKALIASAIERRIHGEGDFFDSSLSQEASAWVDRIVQLAGRSQAAKPVSQATVDGVILDSIETTDVVELGPELVALKAWEELHFTPMLEALGMNPSAIATAQLMVSNRLIEPLSEWALIDWSHRTALPELLDIRITKSAKDRLYRTSDDLMALRKDIESTLRQRERDLFSLSRSVILYDVTNSHFEGLCASNPKAKHGKNKQHRNDCRQVAVGIAFDEHGFPLAHETFEGNMGDTRTLPIILDRLARHEQGLKPVVILDAGFASRANLALLKERGYSYLVNITRGSRSKYADAFKKETFEALPGRSDDEGVEVKKITDPEDSTSHLVLCRSAQRRLKEEAMISSAEKRFLTAAAALGKSIEKGVFKRAAVIERKIGALQKRQARTARFYTLKHNAGRLEITRDEDKMKSAIAQCGDYVLKTDKSLEATQLWELYMTLLQAEAGFCQLKGTLGLRPNFHQLEDRVDGHIFISVLAYHLLRWVGKRLEDHNDTREWQTIRRLLGTHSIVTTRLPLADGRTINIRKPSQPDDEQKRVYQMLGIGWKAAFPTKKTEIPA